jgi:hypothetical protein
LATGFIDKLQMLTTCNYNTLGNSYTRLFTTARTKSFRVLCIRQPFPGNDFQQRTLRFRNIPVSRLPASNSNSSQRLNRNSPLTNSPIRQLTHSTPVHYTNSTPPLNGLHLLHATSLNRLQLNSVGRVI